MTNSSPVTLETVAPGYRRVVFDNPPVNLYDPELAAALYAIVGELEADDDVKASR